MTTAEAEQRRKFPGACAWLDYWDVYHDCLEHADAIAAWAQWAMFGRFGPRFASEVFRP